MLTRGAIGGPTRTREPGTKGRPTPLRNVEYSPGLNTVLQLVATCFLVCATAHAEAPACDSIDSCLEVMRAPPSDLDDSARTDASIFLQRQPTTEALKEQLYGLLGSSNEEVAEGGVRALRTHVTSADTPRLSELLGTGPRVWRLLAEIGDDAAFLALRRFALDDPEAPENATAFLSDFGDRSKRLALELLACTHDCRDPELGVGHVGGSYCQKTDDDDGVSDQDEAALLEIVRNADLPAPHRRLALEAATGCNKQLSEFLLSGLEDIVDAAPPELWNEVLEVLSANGRTRAIDVLVERLSSDTLATLRRLANLGTVAHPALPHVLPLLASPSTAVRAGVIQALLAFEATNACEAIAAVMRDPDPELATAAMNAATTLCPELPAVRDELARVAATYWYPGLQVDARVRLSPREKTKCLGTHDASGAKLLSDVPRLRDSADECVPEPHPLESPERLDAAFADTGPGQARPTPGGCASRHVFLGAGDRIGLADGLERTRTIFGTGVLRARRRAGDRRVVVRRGREDLPLAQRGLGRG